MASSPSEPTADGFEFADRETWARTSRSLQRIARSVVGDDAAAEDIVQNAWVEALEGRPARLGLGRLRKLVQSRSIDLVRRRSREAHAGGPKAAEPMSHQDDPFGSKLEVQREVLEAVDSLNEPYRSTVYLRYFEALVPHAIAKQLGIPEKTVQTRLTRAHRLLRERLATRFLDRDGRWTPAMLGFAGVPVPGLAAPLALAASSLIMKKLAIAAVTVLALLAGWKAFTSARAEPTALPVPSSETSVANDSPGGGELVAAAQSGGEDEREAVAPDPVDVEEQIPVAPEHGSLRVTVQRPSGAPAATVHVVATVEHDARNLQRRFREATDSTGVAYFPALPVGFFSLDCDRREHHIDSGIEIRPDETTEATISLPEGVDVVGRVHDVNQQPVANAGIWLTATSGGWTAGAVVARSDEFGYFEVQGVPPTQSIAAVADGFQPSSMVDLDLLDTTQSPVTIDLSLAPGGANLSGIVRDETGQTLEGVLIVSGDDSRSGGMRMDDTWQESWSPRTTRTDRDGHYAFVGLKTGELSVQARSFEYAQWNAAITLDAGRNEDLNITLSRGAVVRGTITQLEGQTVPGALVLAFSEPQRNRYMRADQFGYSGALMGPAAIADEQGSYVLRQVDPGETWLYALEPRENPDSRQDLVRMVSTQFTLAPDSETVWDPVLSDGRVIEGRALYRDGVEITDVYVILSGPSQDDDRSLFTEDGSFRFLNLGPGPFSIRVQMWMRPEGEPEPLVEGVYPDGPPIDVTATFDSPRELEPATVRVRLVDEAERTNGEPVVILVPSDQHAFFSGGQQDGEWTFEVAEPGSYRALVLHRERVVCTGQEFELRNGDVIELPDLVTQAGGTLVLQIQRPEDPPPTGVRAFLRMRASNHAEAIEVGGQSEVRIDNLEAGAGRISFLGDNIMQLELEFEVRPDEETHLAVPLTAAVPVPFQIKWPGEESKGSLSLRFLERSSGDVVDHYDIEDLTAYPSPIRWSAFLPIGSYTFEVTKNGNLHQREEFEVTSLDPKSAPKVGFDE